MPKPEDGDKKPADDKKDDGKKDDTVAPATLIVNLPTNATLVINGMQMTSTSARRIFESPNLTAGKVYEYDLLAQMIENGQVVNRTRTITVRAGQQSEITFDFNAAIAAK